MIIRPSFSGLFEKNVEPPLDISGMPTARIAYGLRKLRSAYTGAALRIRRSSDNTETDVNFYNGKEVTLNSTVDAGGTLRDFVGSDTAYVTTWYNQSGNTSTQAGGGSWTGYPTAPNAVQTTTGRQPELISSGVVNNALKFVTAGGWTTYGDYFQVNQYRLPNSPDDFTLVWVGQVFDYTNAGGIISNLDNFNDGVETLYLTDASFRLALDANDEDSAGGYAADANMSMIASYDRARASAQGGDGKSQIVRINGNETTRDTNEDKHIGRSDRFRIGVRKISNSPLNGTCREVFVWESQLSDALQVELEKNMAVYNEINL